MKKCKFSKQSSKEATLTERAVDLNMRYFKEC